MNRSQTPRPILAAATLGAALLLAACGSNVKLDEAPVESRSTQPADGGPAVAQAPAAPAGPSRPGVAPGWSAPAAPAVAPRSPVATVDTGNAMGADGWPAERIVYFDFDSFALRSDARPVLEGHAKVLVAQRGKRLIVEGHTDERGGREYNLALGQKRAEAVARSLVLLGATESQVEAVSFGKERPAAEGRDEAAWAKNRRAELKEKR